VPCLHVGDDMQDIYKEDLTNSYKFCVDW